MVSSNNITNVSATETKKLSIQENCRKLLVSLLELSSRNGELVKSKVLLIIQELINGEIEPKEFVDRFAFLIKACPQMSLVGFLIKSVPLLRQSLLVEDLVIKGIRPPSLQTAFPNSIVTNIETQFHQSEPSISQVPYDSVIGQQGPIIQHQQLYPSILQSSAIPKFSKDGIITNGEQIRRPHISVDIYMGQYLPKNKQYLQQQQQQLPQKQQQQSHQLMLQKQPFYSLEHPQLIPAKRKTVKGIQVNSKINRLSASKMNKLSMVSTNPEMVSPQTIQLQYNQNIITSGRPVAKSMKTISTDGCNTLNLQLPTVFGVNNDLNDVATMTGVNLSDESKQMFNSNRLIGTQARLCKDAVFLHMPALQAKIGQIMAKYGLEEADNDVATLISLAVKERITNIVEKLSVIVEHRTDVLKIDPRYEQTKDTRGQLRFLTELDNAAEKRELAKEREILMCAARSRYKMLDPERAKLREKAKEMQREEMEELQQRNANITALNALGPRKKPRLNGDTAGIILPENTIMPKRPRNKYVTLKDMIFYLEQERETCKSLLLHKAYLK